MKRILFYCFLFTTTSFTGCLGAKDQTLRISNEIIESIHKLDRNPAELAALAGKLREKGIPEKGLGKYTDREIGRVYDALLSLTTNFPEEDKFVAMQERILNEEIRRGKTYECDVVDMYTAYLGARMFEKAGTFKKRFPEMKFPLIPETIVSDNPSGAKHWLVYDVMEAGKIVELKALPLETGPKIVVVIFPGCAAAKSAMTQIMADPELTAAIRKYGAIVTDRFDAQGVAKWREYINFREIYIARKDSDFPSFDFQVSPTFYFLKDGKIYSHFSGWSNANGKGNLLKGLDAVLAQDITQH